MGKINFWESMLILVGVLWLLGIFRGFVIPVSVRTRHEKEPEDRPLRGNEVNGVHKPVKGKRYGDDDAEYVEYEEVKDN